MSPATVIPFSGPGSELHSLTDADLVRLAVIPTQSQAFTVLMKRYLKAVYNLVYARVQNATLAEDLTQETFIKVYRALNQFQPDRPFKPWLFTIAINTAKTALKQSAHQPLLFDDAEAGEALLNNNLDKATQPTEPADTALKTKMGTALDMLAPNVRQAMMLRHVQDLPYEDIAVAMSANLNTVRTWLKRGRETLHATLSTDPDLLNAL